MEHKFEQLKIIYRQRLYQKEINAYSYVFPPVKAFVTFEQEEVRDRVRDFYKYEVESMNL